MGTGHTSTYNPVEIIENKDMGSGSEMNAVVFSDEDEDELDF